MTSNEELFARAKAAIPGGVDSPVRAFGAVGGTPYFVARAEGPYVWDVEGRRFIDLVQSYGAVILGHAHPAITEAVTRAAADGTSYGAPTAREVELAEVIENRVPGCERLRLVSSGTEATMSAIRVARGFTGRDRIVKFAGCYHGHSDQLLVAGGSGVATLGLPGSAGVPAGAVADTIVAPYNVVPDLDDTVACVIVEPYAANMGLVPPVEGFLPGLRAECDRVGALLVFDEVITGFRITPGSVQHRVGARPDLWCFGKVIGGGLPVGAFGGRADVMAVLAPDGPVYQAGTLSGNPLATAAGLAVLAELTPDVYETLTARATRLADGLHAALVQAGIGSCAREGTILGLWLGATDDGRDRPRDYDDSKRRDEAVYARFFHAMLGRGVALAPGAFEVTFVGLAHADDIIDEVIAAAHAAAHEAAASASASSAPPRFHR